MPLEVRESNPVADDISRRADLGDAYRRGKRVGIVFGALGATLTTWAALFLVGRIHPAWLAQLFAWLAGGAR